MSFKKRIAILLLFLLCFVIVVQAQVTDETRFMVTLNERLEKNKAEVIKEVKTQSEATKQELQANMDANFIALDAEIDKKLKTNNQNYGIIIVAGFLGAFVVSQIIRLQIEKMQRRAMIGQVWRLEQKLMELKKTQESLQKATLQLETQEKNIYAKLQSYKVAINPVPKYRFAVIGVLCLIIGVGIGFLLWKVMPSG